MADTRIIDSGKLKKSCSGTYYFKREYTGEHITVRATRHKWTAQALHPWSLEAYTSGGYCIAWCDSATYEDLCEQALTQALQEWKAFGITNAQMQEFISLYTGIHEA